MPDPLDEKEASLQRSRERYSRPQSNAAREVERAVLGHEVGLNGYTTVEQAQALCDLLRLNPDTAVLDLGTGRGWPGTHLVRASGCRLVASDLPMEALIEAKHNFEKREPDRVARMLLADGRQLPFRSECFDVVVHADVFC